jgi:serine palmitoyltransferase
MYDMLFDAHSANDPGSMCSNVNVTDNINAKTKNVLDNFNYCKDFVKLETDAFIVAATMDFFDMTELNTDVVPKEVKGAAKNVKRLWLHSRIKILLQKHIMGQQQTEIEQMVEGVAKANLPAQSQQFNCRGCGKVCKETHEKKHHPELQLENQEPLQMNKKSNEEEDPKDHIYNYACVRLSLGLLIRNFEDAVKEGDGARKIRCLKFMMLIFKAHNHGKYAYAALQLQAQVKCLLPPEIAHLLVWNRCVNNKGGAGKNIPLDLRMEHIVRLLKDLLSNMGPNLTEKAALRCSRAVNPVEKILESIDAELDIRLPSGKHTAARTEKDFQLLVHQLHKEGKVFAFLPEGNRQYISFPNFKRNILGKFNYMLLNKWINIHKKQWSEKI